ncbi:hypothetical protein PINS_up000324 [Pythium insidiosum]|nr:hypothetical protein PINS_up000324 [Pythium insidiosum]
MWSALEFFAAGIVASPSTVAIALILCVFGYYSTSDRRARALRKLPRPPSTLPVLGNTMDVAKHHRERVHDWLYDESLPYAGKPWVMTTLGRTPAVVLCTEAHFDDVLRQQFDVFIKGSLGSELARDFFGEGIFAVDDDKWRHQRKTASYLFSHQMMRDIMEQAVMEDAAQVCTILERAAQRGERVELKRLMDNYTTDVFTQIAFGERLGCLRGEHDFDPVFHQAFTRGPIAIQRRAQTPTWLWKLQRWLNVGPEKQFAEDMEIVNRKVFEIVESVMKRSNDGSMDVEDSKAATKKNLISLFLNGPVVNDIEPTPTLIRDMALNFIAAGRGTTAQSLSWFFVMINRHQSIYENVMEEIRQELPELVAGAKSVPSMDDVQRLVYLEATIKECMRLYPPVPMNSRVARTDTTLSDGTFIPEGTRVIIPTYAVGRFKWIWGDDASEFKPERWIDASTGKLTPVSPSKYLIFNAGPRYCLGAKLAMLEIKVLLSAILSKFDVRIARNPHDVVYAMSLALPIKGELHADVRPVTPLKMPQEIAASATTGASIVGVGG